MDIVFHYMSKKPDEGFSRIGQGELVVLAFDLLAALTSYEIRFCAVRKVDSANLSQRRRWTREDIADIETELGWACEILNKNAHLWGERAGFVLGATSEAAAKDDLVVALAECDSLVLLRPAGGDCYRFVGPISVNVVQELGIKGIMTEDSTLRRFDIV
jgi:hypothetical protein